jgi:Lon protease-like protein
VPDDVAVAPAPAQIDTVRALANAIATMKTQGTQPFLEPYELDNAGWVANRWCEILPIPMGAKQKLMELSDPAIRLQLVDEFLRSKGVVK